MQISLVIATYKFNNIFLELVIMILSGILTTWWNANTTSLVVTDPTPSVRTITLPDATGT